MAEDNLNQKDARSNSGTLIRDTYSKIKTLEEEKLKIQDMQKTLKASIRRYKLPIPYMLKLQGQTKEQALKAEKLADQQKKAAMLLGKTVYCGAFDGSEYDPYEACPDHKEITNVLSQIKSLDSEILDIKDKIDMAYVDAKLNGLSTKALKAVVKQGLNPNFNMDWKELSPIIDKYREVVNIEEVTE